MAQYPTTIYPSTEGYIVTPTWKTITTSNDKLVEQRKQKSSYPTYDVSLTYDYLSEADFRTLWDFYMSRKGSALSFYIYDLFQETHTALFVGNGDGVIATFDIPGRISNSTLTKIYVNGSEVTLNTDYTISTGTGVEGSDQVVFPDIPALGQVIICTFYGYLRIFGRFAEDSLSREHFEFNCFKTGIKIKGLIPENV